MRTFDAEHVPPGWRAIARWALAALKDLPAGERACIEYVGWKEKYGTFRLEVLPSDTNGSEGIALKAEAMSERTCMQCGAPGEERKGPWISTLCDRCANKAP